MIMIIVFHSTLPPLSLSRFYFPFSLNSVMNIKQATIFSSNVGNDGNIMNCIFNIKNVIFSEVPLIKSLTRTHLFTSRLRHFPKKRRKCEKQKLRSICG